MNTSTRLRYGNTGLAAERVHHNFELCLMLILSVVLSGLLLPLVTRISGYSTGFNLTVLVALSVGIWLITFEIFNDIVEV